VVEGEEAKTHTPMVTTWGAEQVDFGHVLIRYDVEDANRNTMTVSMKVSANK